jgi:hypothetical protein
MYQNIEDLEYRDLEARRIGVLWYKDKTNKTTGVTSKSLSGNIELEKFGLPYKGKINFQVFKNHNQRNEADPMSYLCLSWHQRHLLKIPLLPSEKDNWGFNKWDDLPEFK